ncbi:MAG: sugar phosphate isomerase/epimerase [Candidatus Hydrogenedentes bacterium]|nr:sugar phosphate isomerase/epimerase [Candidatus Hydrogenedentota bacterium]
MAEKPYALQLYTVRDQLERDVSGTLAVVRKIGFRYVELAGTQGHAPGEYKRLLDQAGLSAVSAHIGYEEVVQHPENAVAYARCFGLRFIVVPWLGGEGFHTREAWTEAARRMDAAGEILRRAGVRLCYHNHAHEFACVDGERIHDLLFKHSEPGRLAVQLDTCWAAVGGVDPVRLINAYGERVPLLHIKDYKVEDRKPALTEAGRGRMNWAPIFDAAREAGVAWYIVEQDDNFVPGADGAPDSLESARISGAYVANLL